MTTLNLRDGITSLWEAGHKGSYPYFSIERALIYLLKTLIISDLLIRMFPVALLLLNSRSCGFILGVDGEPSQTSKAGSILRLLNSGTPDSLTPLLDPCQ